MGVLLGYQQYEKHISYDTNKEVCITSRCAFFLNGNKIKVFVYCFKNPDSLPPKAG